MTQRNQLVAFLGSENSRHASCSNRFALGQFACKQLIQCRRLGAEKALRFRFALHRRFLANVHHAKLAAFIKMREAGIGHKRSGR